MSDLSFQSFHQSLASLLRRISQSLLRLAAIHHCFITCPELKRSFFLAYCRSHTMCWPRLENLSQRYQRLLAYLLCYAMSMYYLYLSPTYSQSHQHRVQYTPPCFESVLYHFLSINHLKTYCPSIYSHYAAESSVNLLTLLLACFPIQLILGLLYFYWQRLLWHHEEPIFITTHANV